MNEKDQRWHREWKRKYNAIHPDRQRLWTTRSWARKRNIPFNLTEEDVAAPKVCPVLGIPLVVNRGPRGTGPMPNSPSVDRIDPTKGYTKGNVQIISHRANAMKQNATPEELRQFACWVFKTYGE